MVYELKQEESGSDDISIVSTVVPAEWFEQNWEKVCVIVIITAIVSVMIICSFLFVFVAVPFGHWRGPHALHQRRRRSFWYRRRKLKS